MCNNGAGGLLDRFVLLAHYWAAWWDIRVLDNVRIA
jgi:hypothetical protein